MKTPSEKFRKQSELIANGSIVTGDSINIPVDFSKYDKLILEIRSGTYIQGASYILEIDENGQLINEGVNFNNYVTSSYNCLGFFYKSATNVMTLKCEQCLGWSSRNYYVRGILKN